MLKFEQILRAQNTEEMLRRSASSQQGRGGPARFFSVSQYATLRSLCDSIIPATTESGGALEAKAPELIDLIARENESLRTEIGGGLIWLDAACHDRYGSNYLDCLAAQKKEILDLISHRKSAVANPTLAPGIAFFSQLRSLTVGAYFTSEIGMKYVRYEGNHFLSEFPGCPTPDTP